MDSDEPGDYSSMPLNICIDGLPEGSRLHQAALLYLEGPTPAGEASGMTPAQTKDAEMEKVITITRTVTVYVEVTRKPATSAAPVIDVTPEPARLDAPDALPFRKGDLVAYTSKAGNTRTYRVGWVGLNRDGKPTVGLPKPRGAGKGYFFVPAETCRLA